MECKARFQICDMGYFECQEPKGHLGDHCYSHKPTKQNSWPNKEYVVYWQTDPIKDVIVTEEWLRTETNYFEIIQSIVDNPENGFIGFTYNYDDDYDAAPSAWLNFDKKDKTKFDPNTNNDEFFDKLRDDEHELYLIINENVKTNDGIFLRDFEYHTHIGINAFYEENENEK